MTSSDRGTSDLSVPQNPARYRDIILRPGWLALHSRAVEKTMPAFRHSAFPPVAAAAATTEPSIYETTQAGTASFQLGHYGRPCVSFLSFLPWFDSRFPEGMLLPRLKEKGWPVRVLLGIIWHQKRLRTRRSACDRVFAVWSDLVRREITGLTILYSVCFFTSMH